MLSQISGGKIEIIEQEFFEIHGTVEIHADMLIFLAIAVAITLQDICKAVCQGYNLVMQYPFVGIKDQFLGAKYAVLIQFSRKMTQNYMLGNDFADLRVAKIDAYLSAYLRVMAAGLNAQGLGYIVQQCAGNRYFSIWQVSRTSSVSP